MSLDSESELQTMLFFWDWSNTLENSLFNLESQLSSPEQSACQSFLSKKRRLEFITGRYLLRWFFKEALQTPVPEVLATDKNGKPRPIQGWHFNLSHSTGMTTFGVSRVNAVGVDVEFAKQRESSQKILKMMASPQEQKHYSTLSPTNQQAFFYQVWTQKEAYGKATGLGLQENLSSITMVQQRRGDKKTQAHWETALIGSHWVSLCQLSPSTSDVIWKKVVLDSDNNFKAKDMTSSQEIRAFGSAKS